ncbi:hypothetical protein LTR62_005378 [Meristemomyces frigidus]|uniref:Erythromycin biosynthesis protein CIII-like C-terminal domain-containing protein n=1 Tax=Meristemomyces frigidus TaxID=1508187 RepID=A0AAN7TDC7_9PEZI|nr:hypothetical protein LTR62_005378 [Meristemomyces frigidus]
MATRLILDSDVHLVLSACPAYGHVRPLRSLAQSLSELGIYMTFITGSAFRESLSHIKGLDVVPLTGKADYSMDDLAKFFPERANVPKGPFQFLWDMENVFFGSLPEQHKVLQSVLKRPDLVNKKVVLISDAAFTGCMPMILGSPGTRRVPLIGTSFFPLAVQSKDTAPFGMGLPSQGEAKNMEMNAQATQMLSGLGDFLDQQLKPYNCTKTLPSRNPIENWFLIQDILMQLCVPAMEPYRSDLRPSFRYIGTFTGANTLRSPPDWFSSFVENDKSGKPLLMVSQGTIAGGDVSELILPTIKACADLPVRLIVCAVALQKPADFVLPENCKWAEWIPYELLFPHVNLVVNNGGYSAICQAFAAGIPMVVAGLTEDKAEATARSAATGAAINLATQTPSVEHLRDAIQKVLQEPSYKAKAMGLKRDFAECDAVGSMIEGIQEMIGKFYGTAEMNGEH